MSLKVLGIDLGERRVGVALWDDPDLSARPLAVLTQQGDALVTALLELATREQATHVVFGYPLKLDGSEGQSARNAKRFAKLFEKKSGLTVALQDERLTTRQAQTERILAGRKGREGIDAHAATILLQTWIDTHEEQWRKDARKDR